MLTTLETEEMERVHQDEMDFLCELGNKYDMTECEMRRLCFFAGVEYAKLQKHTLENSNVIAHH